MEHAIDKACGLRGSRAASPGSHLQNRAKNNFCATASSGPEIITPHWLVELQARTTVPSGYRQEPTNRTALEDLGEGKLVRMKGYLLEAHHADLGGGESVNCNRPKEGDNDVHIAFGPHANTKECDSVTAEISPHYRPDSWNEIGHFETYDSSTSKYIPNPAMAARLRAHPYRVTGQLFFDASHQACPCGTACSPVRAAVWEVHPVYSIEVCKSGTSCDVNQDSNWIAFDKWWNSLVPISKVQGPHAHIHKPN